MTTNERDKRILALRDQGRTYNEIAVEVFGDAKKYGTVYNVIVAARGKRRETPSKAKAKVKTKVPVTVKDKIDKDVSLRATHMYAWSLYNDNVPMSMIAKKFNVSEERAKEYVAAGAERFEPANAVASIHLYPPDAGASVQTVVSYKTAATPHRGVITYIRNSKFVYAWQGPWRADPMEAEDDAIAEIKRDGFPVEATG